MEKGALEDLQMEEKLLKVTLLGTSERSVTPSMLSFPSDSEKELTILFTTRVGVTGFTVVSRCGAIARGKTEEEKEVEINNQLED